MAHHGKGKIQGVSTHVVKLSSVKQSLLIQILFLLGMLHIMPGKERCKNRPLGSCSARMS